MDSLHCIAENGEIFIVEMQRIRQEHFKDRSLFYASRVIQRQLKKGSGPDRYKLPEVYLIAILEFPMNPQNRERYFHDVALIEKHSGEIFYNKLGFKFLEIANFAKTGDQLATNMDKWLYLLKHMGDLDRIPYFLDNRIFRRIFQLSEVANLNKEEQMHYEDRFMIEWDREAVLEWAKKEGLRIGMEQGLEQGLQKGVERGLEQGKTSAQKAMIRNLISGFGFTDEQAAKAASVSINFVRQIRLEMNEES